MGTATAVHIALVIILLSSLVFARSGRRVVRRKWLWATMPFCSPGGFFVDALIPAHAQVSPGGSRPVRTDKPVIEDKKVLVDGKQFAYSIAGTGPTVLMVQGNTDATQWRRLRYLLARRNTVISISANALAEDGGKFDVQRGIKHLRAFAEALSVKKPYVVSNGRGV